ncbi:MAG: hypothetical protein M1118_06545 [Chloroflexi bacterium]|nr:hypothetical protein [Chloroflexota bacterium]
MNSKSLLCLPYRLRLDAPALVSGVTGDPNTVSGERYVPGASIWGACATEWISRKGLGTQAHANAGFARLFLQGALQFLNAYPQLEGDAERSLPLPLSLRKPKHGTGDWMDLAACYEDGEDADSEPEGAEARVEGFGRLRLSCEDGGDRGVGVQVAMRARLVTHIARSDRLLARPTAEDEALFTYSALDGGQEFRGLVLGAQHDLELLRQVLFDEEDRLMLRIGRSRSAEYGGQARLTPGAVREYTGEIEESETQERDEGLVLTLTAPLIPPPGVRESGRLAFPIEQLARLLQVAGVRVQGEALSKVRPWVRTVTVGGFSGVWKLPRPQEEALAAGSVFLFPEFQMDQDQRASIQRRALGQRTAEGFGRFVLDWHGRAVHYRVVENQPRRPPSQPGSEVPEVLRGVVLEMARTWARERVRTKGLEEPTLQRYREMTAAHAKVILALLDDYSAKRDGAIRRQLKEWQERLRRSEKAVPRLITDLLEKFDQPFSTWSASVTTTLGVVSTDLPQELRQLLTAIDRRDALEQEDVVRTLLMLYYRTLCEKIYRECKTEKRSQSAPRGVEGLDR